MKMVLFKNVDGVILGRARVGEDDELVVEAETGSGLDLNDLLVGGMIVTPKERVHPSDGKRCLEILPDAFRGPYFIAIPSEARDAVFIDKRSGGVEFRVIRRIG